MKFRHFISVKPLTAICISFIFFNIQAQEKCEKQPWLNHTLPIDERVEMMISCMTLEEKVSQLLNDSKEIPRLGIERYNWWSEALHGVARSGKATVFPQSIAMASTFDANLMLRIGTAISDEARAINNHLVERNGTYIRYMGLSFWSPNVNIFRDPRWGRGQETFGEDPFLSGAIGSAFIKGMQGNHPKYLKTAACAKHFAVHSGPEADRHHFNAIASPKDMYETYLPAFKACVDADVEAIMCAYNRTNNEGCCGSKTLLVDILKSQWGFDGHIVSDCGALANFHNHHKLTKTPAESAALAVKSGVNVNCGNTYSNLAVAVEQGLISEDEIDAVLRPLVRTRFKLGFFDPREEVPFTNIPVSVINSDEHRSLAREAAQKAVVLLQNKNNVLPLKKDLDFVYFGGPFAGDMYAMLGNYNGLSNNVVTLVEGVVDKLSPSTRVQYRFGTRPSEYNKNPIDWYSGQASLADVTIVGLGLTILLEGEEGEAIASATKGDNLSMKLPENQLAYLRKLRGNHKKPIVAVIFAGCPLDLTEVSKLADVIIYAWYPGEEGGNAIADVIFGDVAPSGKLPITFPKSVDQLPSYEDYNMEGRTYKYMTETPMYPFGYGISYSSVKIKKLELDKQSITKDDELDAIITFHLDGEIHYEEVFQVYVSLLDSDERVPQADLKIIERIKIEPGIAIEHRFILSPEAFNYIDEHGNTKRHVGKAKITIGNASPGMRSKELGAVMVEAFVEVR